MKITSKKAYLIGCSDIITSEKSLVSDYTVVRKELTDSKEDVLSKLEGFGIVLVRETSGISQYRFLVENGKEVFVLVPSEKDWDVFEIK